MFSFAIPSPFYAGLFRSIWPRYGKNFVSVASSKGTRCFSMITLVRESERGILA